MSDRLTVRVTADSLEGALNRARGEAERYFGSRPFGVVGTTSSSAFGHGYFITEVTFESTELAPSVAARCGEVSQFDHVCDLPAGHPGRHVDSDADASWP